MLLKYNLITNTLNSYETETESSYTSTLSTKYEFIGIGCLYNFDLNTSWSLFPEISVSQPLGNDRVVNEFLAVGSINIGYSISKNKIYSGISTQYIFSSSNLTYMPSLGIRLGYSYLFDNNVSANIGFEFLTLKSENKAGNIYNQQTEMRSIIVALGYNI